MAFKDWGWITNGQKPPHLGRRSLLVRVAKLETDVRELRSVLKRVVEGTL